MSVRYLKSIVGALCAVAAIAAFSFARPAQAQDVGLQQLVFQNNTAHCALVTLYGYTAGGIGGMFSAWNITGAQPRIVHARQTVTFTFRRTPRLDVRAEVYRSGCNHPLAADVRTEQINIRNLDILRANLQSNGASFRISHLSAR